MYGMKVELKNNFILFCKFHRKKSLVIKSKGFFGRLDGGNAGTGLGGINGIRRGGNPL